MSQHDRPGHRKSVVATSALIGVLAFATNTQAIEWAGVNIKGYVVWILLAVAHVYFFVMFAASFDGKGFETFTGPLRTVWRWQLGKTPKWLGAFTDNTLPVVFWLLALGVVFWKIWRTYPW